MPGFWKNRFRTVAWALLAAGLLSSCAGLREGARPYTLTLLHINLETAVALARMRWKAALAGALGDLADSPHG